jgi:hypothetical protein
MFNTILLLILLLVFLPCARAGTGSVLTTLGGTAGSADECASTLVCQNFEGTGYDNSETWTEDLGTGGAIDEDYTSTVLRGSQSLSVDAGTSTASTCVSFTASDEISGYLRLRVLSDSSSAVLVLYYNATPHMTIGYNAGNNKYIMDGTNLGATSFTVPVTHYAWFHWKKGTGADEINRWWFSSSSRTWPGDGNEDINITNGASTAQVNKLCLQDSGNGPVTIFDQVVAKTGTTGLITIPE